MREPRKIKWLLTKKTVFFSLLLLFTITSIPLFVDKTFAKTEGSLNKHYNLGKEYYQRENFLEARKEFKEALRLDPSHRWSKLYLKCIEEKIGKEVSTTPQRLIEETPPSGIKEKIGKEVSTVPQELTEEAPPSGVSLVDAQAVKTHYNQGKRYFEQGDYQSAKDEFEEVLSLYPEHVYARKYLIEARQKLPKEVIKPGEVSTALRRERAESSQKIDSAKYREEAKQAEAESTRRLQEQEQKESEAERARLLAKLEEYKKAEEREGDLGELDRRSGVEDLAEEELRLRKEVERYEQAKRKKEGISGTGKEDEEGLKERLEEEILRRQKAEEKLASLQERLNAELRTQIAKHEEKLKLGEIREHLIKGKEFYNQGNLVSAREEFQGITNIEPGHKEATKCLALIEKVEGEIRRKEEKNKKEVERRVQLEAERLAKEEAERRREEGLKSKREEERIKKEELFKLKAQRREANIRLSQEEKARKKEEQRLKAEKKKEENLKREAEKQAIAKAKRILKDKKEME